jgi:hypothetical protein
MTPRRRILTLWLVIAIVGSVCACIALSSGMAAQLEATANRLKASEAEFPVSLLGHRWFRGCLVAVVPLSLGCALAAVLVGGASVATRLLSLFRRAHS